MPDVIGMKEFHAVRFLVQGEYEYTSKIADEVRESERFKKLKNPTVIENQIKLIYGADSIEPFLDDTVSNVYVDTDADGSEPIYGVPVKAQL